MQSVSQKARQTFDAGRRHGPAAVADVLVPLPNFATTHAE